MEACRFKSVLSGLVGVMLLGGLASRPAWAQTISVTNPGFESNALADGGFTLSITGWTIAGSAGTYNPTSTQYPGGVPEGMNVAFINGGSISQVLGATLTADTSYTLQVDVGDRADTPFPVYSVGLYAGGVLLAEDPGLLLPPNGTFLTSTVTFLALVGNPNLGQPLEIRLANNGVQTNFDNVRLEALDVAAIPEPGTCALVAMGLLPLAGSVVRRRRA